MPLVVLSACAHVAVSQLLRPLAVCLRASPIVVASVCPCPHVAVPAPAQNTVRAENEEVDTGRTNKYEGECSSFGESMQLELLDSSWYTFTYADPDLLFKVDDMVKSIRDSRAFRLPVIVPSCIMSSVARNKHTPSSFNGYGRSSIDFDMSTICRRTSGFVIAAD